MLSRYDGCAVAVLAGGECAGVAGQPGMAERDQSVVLLGGYAVFGYEGLGEDGGSRDDEGNCGSGGGEGEAGGEGGEEGCDGGEGGGQGEGCEEGCGGGGGEAGGEGCGSA